MKNLESNKLIANFMNVQPIQYDEHYQWNDGVYFSVSGVEKDKVLQHIYEYVKYAESWDWLMPVVEKITSISLLDNVNECNYIYIGFDYEDNSHYVNLYHGEDAQINGFSKTDKIEAVYAAVVEFIKWYNKNK